MQTINSPISQTSDTDKEQLPQIARIPLLQKALDGLDTSLDEELDRYRHWQENGQTFSYLNPFRAASRLGAISSLNNSGTTSETNGASALPHLPKMSLPLTPTANQADKNVGNGGDELSYQGNPESQHSKVKSTQSVISDQPNFTAADLLEQLAATTIEIPETPNPDLGDPNQEISEDDLFQAISDEYANDEEFNSDDLAEEYEEYEEYEESSSSGFRLFSHLGIAGLCLLLAASGFIGYLVIDPAGITKLLKPGTPTPATPATSNVPESNDSSDITLKKEAPTVDPDTLIADPKKNPKLVPFVRLPGKLPQPGQSVKGFTANTPDRPSTPTLSVPGLPTNLSTNKERPAASKLSVPALSTTKTARLAPPTALPPTFLPYHPESNPKSHRVRNTYTPPARETYTPPVQNTYVPPARETYTPPARETYTPPAPVYRSNPEPRPQVTPAPSRPRVTSKWKPRTTTPTLNTPSKTAANSRIPIALSAPSKANTTAITAPPVRDSAPVRYTSPISSAPTNPTPETPARPANVAYKVVAPTSYLPQAQAVDKDAYVRPSGEVQLGAYQNAKAAQQRADDLRRQGIPVQVEQQ
jgi:hypothetical protein